MAGRTPYVHGLLALGLVVAGCSDEPVTQNASDAGVDQAADAVETDADAGEPDVADTGEPDSADTGPDADASNPLDLSCENVPFPTSVPDPVTVSGQVTDNGTSGLVANLEVHRADDDSLIDSVATGADGAYSLTVPTGGVPTAVYFRITATGHVETYRYFGYPLTANTTSPQRIWTSTAFQAYASKGGVAPTAGKGVAYLIARDCALKKVGAGVVYTTTPTPQKLAYEEGAQCDTPNLQATASTQCSYAMSFELTPGMLAVDATLGSTGFRAQNVKIAADAMTWVVLQPDRP